MLTLIFGLVLLIIGLSIIAAVLDKMQHQFNKQFDQVKKENRELQRRVSYLEFRNR
ncbi:hypothetical protein J7E81_15530 [Bacillus sp. ISL-18]|uniref:hypothetical protein n=1 Tax=Bacillus sp. ISL-18 TaxID=2819118 RepID=UPI001BE99BBC|nr:hypothetical protein [Bacillus sp. ISL-18]MBT2656630.1 hypothetical protein [Bacillus sp. ISL-18]